MLPSNLLCFRFLSVGFFFHSKTRFKAKYACHRMSPATEKPVRVAAYSCFISHNALFSSNNNPQGMKVKSLLMEH